MKLKTRIIAGIIFSIVFVLGFGLLQLYLFQRQQIITQTQLNPIAQIQREVSELSILTYDFFLNPLERKEQQWVELNTSITNNLQKLPFPKGSKQQELSAQLNDLNKQIKLQFDEAGKTILQINELQTLNTTKEASSSGLLQQKQEQLTGQVLITTQEMSTTIFELRNLAVIDRETASTQALIVTLLGLIFLLAVITFTSLSNLPLIKFIELVGAISRGDFSRHLDITRKDEVGDLARAFDRMAISLKLAMRDQPNTPTAISPKVKTAENSKIISEEPQPQK